MGLTVIVGVIVAVGCVVLVGLGVPVGVCVGKGVGLGGVGVDTGVQEAKKIAKSVVIVKVFISRKVLSNKLWGGCLSVLWLI